MNHWLQGAGLAKPNIAPRPTKPKVHPLVGFKHEGASVNLFAEWVVSLPVGSVFTAVEAAEKLNMTHKYARELALTLEHKGLIKSSRIKTVSKTGYTRSSKAFVKEHCHEPGTTDES